MKGTEQNHLLHARKFANKQGEIRFNWKVRDFSQLCEMLYTNDGDIQVVVRGRIDLNKRCLFDAQIKANLTLECQTSFEPINFIVDQLVTYCTVTDEDQVGDLDEQYEPVIIEDGLFDVRKAIEDELILAIPIAANKPAEELAIKMSYGELDEEAISKEKEANNPFSVLTGLNKD